MPKRSLGNGVYGFGARGARGLRGVGGIALAAYALAALAAGCELDPVAPPGGGPSGGDAGADGAGPAPGLGIDEAPAAVTVASVAFARDVADTFAAGDNAILAYQDRDIAVLDLSDARAPKTHAPLATAARVVSVAYDDERAMAFAVDAGGTLYVVNLASAASAAVVASLGAPTLAGKATGVARVGDRLYVAAGKQLFAFALTVPRAGAQGDASPTLTALGPTELPREATALASGAGVLYVGVAGASGAVVEAYTTRGASPTKVSEFAVGGALRALLAKGSKLLVLSNGVGLTTLDFGLAAAPRMLARLGEVRDVSAAKLFGPTLLVGLDQGLTTTLDVTRFAAPVAVTTNKGGLPKFFAVVSGNVFVGEARKGEVRAVPPVVTDVVPELLRRDFPIEGQLPVTFSKPIDPSSVTPSAVTMTCNGQPVAGTPILSADRLTVSFRPTSPLPTSASCKIDLSGLRDATGQPLAQGGSGATFEFTTARAAATPSVNAKSSIPHKADGAFTGLAQPPADGGADGLADASAPSAPDATSGDGRFEWSDVKPAKGMYTYFYADFDGANLWLLNDWFYNGTNIDPDCYNQFAAWTGDGQEQWDIRAYGDQRVEVRKNGEVLDGKAVGVEGGAGYGASPNVAEPHTIYELKIPARPGRWGVQLHDPGPTFHCSHRPGDPSNMTGSLDQRGPNGGVSSTVGTVVVNAPAPPVLASPSDRAENVPLSPTLVWESASRADQFVGYQVEVSTAQDFRSDVRRYTTANTRYTLPSGALTGGTRYFWRVSAWNSSGTSPSTTTRSFVTVPVTTADSRLVTVSYTGQGTIASSPDGISCGSTCSASFPLGTTVTLVATPAEGFRFSAFTGDCTTNAQGTGAQFVVDSNKNCVARFDRVQDASFNLVVSKVGNGSVASAPAGIACGSDCTENFANGTNVTLTATADQGYEFVSWTGACAAWGSNKSAIVTMNENKACTANFRQTTQTVPVTITLAGTGSGNVQTSDRTWGCFGGTCQWTPNLNATLTLVATPSQGSTFTSWGGACAQGGTNPTVTIVADQAKACTATFAQAQSVGLSTSVTPAGGGYVTSSPAGILCGNGCQTTFPQNTNVTLTATPLANYRFQQWNGATCTCTPNSSAPGGCTSPVITLAMTQARACGAVFAATTNTNVTVTLNNSGIGTVSSTPEAIYVSGGDGISHSAAFATGSTVRLTAKPNANHTFGGWAGDCAASCTGGAAGTCMNPVLDFTAVGASMSCVANFIAPAAAATVTIAKTSGAATGTITSTVHGGCAENCASQSANVTPPRTITFAASPAANYDWGSWGGLCASCAARAQCTVNVTQSGTCSVDFVARPSFQLTTSVIGNGAGTVTSNPGGIQCAPNNVGTCQALLDTGSNVGLTATPDATSVFRGWSGSAGCTGAANPLTLAMTEAKSCTATFQRNTLTLSTSGTNEGRITSDVGNLACGNGASACTGVFAGGTQVTLTADPGPTGVFQGWSGSGCSGTANPTVVTMNGAANCHAAFAVQTHAFNYTKAGTGAGFVSVSPSSPSGSCGGSCAKTVNRGVQTTVTAQAQAGSTFAGWSGDALCATAGTNASFTYTPTGTLNCTATFNLQQHVLTVVNNVTSGASDSPGFVFSSPSGISCGASCQKAFNAGNVTLTAVADQCTFTGWSGCSTSTSTQISVSLTGATTCTANYACP